MPDYADSNGMMDSACNSGNTMVKRETLAQAKQAVRRLAALPSLLGEFDWVSMPQYVIFNASNVCNLRCPHCWSHATPEERKRNNDRKNDLPRDVLLKTAAECLPFASEYSLTMSGEPLMLRNIEELISSLGTWDARLNLVTNGTCLEPRIIAAILPRVSNIAISIDGAFASTFESLRLGAKFKSFIANVRVLTRSLELLPQIHRPGICLAFTSMGSNLLDLPQLIRLAHALRINSVQTTPIKIAPGRDDIAGEDMQYHWPAFSKVVAAAQEAANSLGIAINAYLPEIIHPASTPADSSKMILSLPILGNHFPEEAVEELLPTDQIELKANKVAALIHQRKIVSEVPLTKSAENCLQRIVDADNLARQKFAAKCRTLLSSHPPSMVYRCRSLEKHFYVSQKGDVKACCTLGLPDFGNIFQQSIWDVWNGAVYKEFRRQFQSETPPQCCVNCVFRKKTPVYEIARENGILDAWAAPDSELDVRMPA
jgi:MoaA/NifB/PqqE/SkfB family radical SAM enzyme